MTPLTKILITGILLVMRAQAFSFREERRQSFAEGERVPALVSALRSTETLYPLDYYDAPFCKPKGDGVDAAKRKQNLGENLLGERIQSSPYYLEMKKDLYCEKLCVQDLGGGGNFDRNKADELIQKDYHINWIIDNLPAASRLEDDRVLTVRYWQGTPIGFVEYNSAYSVAETGKTYIYNHVNIEIMYHKSRAQKGKYEIVRVMIAPFSIKHDFNADTAEFSTNPIASCDTKLEHTTWEMVTEGGREPQWAVGKVLFTYDVRWIENTDLDWSSRWELYTSMDHAVPDIFHWMSVANSICSCLFLTTILVAGLLKCVRKERDQYISLATTEEGDQQVESSGWIAIRGDVFRPPKFLPTLFLVMCGTGAQLLSTCFVVVALAACGFMSSARRGHLLMGLLVTFCSMGIVAGYVSARLGKVLKQGNWKRVTAFTALGFPGIAFGFFIIINAIERAHHSTKAVSALTFVTLGMLWICISVPLVYLGAYCGYRYERIQLPFEPMNDEYRPLPKRRHWSVRILFVLLRFSLFDVLPFAAFYVEFFYMMFSVWMGYYYASYGFLFLTLIAVVVTSAFTAVVITYFRFRREDYRWWWSSLTTSGAIGVYTFLYSVVYWMKQLQPADGLAVCLGYMFLVSVGLTCMFGCVGVLASLLFTKQMYTSLLRDRPTLIQHSIELADSRDLNKQTTKQIQNI